MRCPVTALRSPAGNLACQDEQEGMRSLSSIGDSQPCRPSGTIFSLWGGQTPLILWSGFRRSSVWLPAILWHLDARCTLAPGLLASSGSTRGSATARRSRNARPFKVVRSLGPAGGWRANRIFRRSAAPGFRHLPIGRKHDGPRIPLAWSGRTAVWQPAARWHYQHHRLPGRASVRSSGLWQGQKTVQGPGTGYDFPIKRPRNDDRIGGLLI